MIIEMNKFTESIFLILISTKISVKNKPEIGHIGSTIVTLKQNCRIIYKTFTIIVPTNNNTYISYRQLSFQTSRRKGVKNESYER